MRLKLSIFCYFFLIGLAHSEALMQSEEIIEKLSLKSKTRGLVLERNQCDIPTVNFDNILFDYNSYSLNESSFEILDQIGNALSSEELKGNRFEIVGFTDSKGDAFYNQKLSEKRALSVLRYFVGKFGIAQSNLVSTGKGETMLLPNIDPTDSKNRRVEIRNISNQKCNP